MRTLALSATLLLVVLLANISEGHKVLFLVPFTGPSHWLMLKHFIRELTDRGHEVTCITSFKFGEPLSNYTEVLIDPAWPIREKFPLSEIYNTANYNSDFNNLFMYWRLGLESSRHGLENKYVQKFLNRNDLQFDLVVSEQFFQESWLMFAHKYKAPIVTISTYGYSDFMDRAMGLLTPWSYVPHMILNFDDQMSFTQRVYNAMISLTDYVIREFYYLPEQNKMAKEFFGDLEQTHGPLPTVQALEKSISVILVNSHPTLAKPRPSMVGLVDIAGAHIRPPKPLPEDLQRFMDEAKHGVIYFSLGAYLQSSEIPPEKRAILLRVFSKLKQRVVWKFETDNIANVPSNVMIRKWAPQNDILAHKNMVLFIAHGGQFGTFESMYHGVPTLFMPFFGDQHRNAIRATRSGYADQMLFKDVTEESLSSAIRRLTEDKRFYARAKEISALFRDTMVEPMNQSIYWMEYVIRHKGAPHLKSHALNLSIGQYLLLDVLGAGLLGVMFVVGLLKFCFCRKGSQRDMAKKDQ